jgi:hypothetical protein
LLNAHAKMNAAEQTWHNVHAATGALARRRLAALIFAAVAYCFRGESNRHCCNTSRFMGSVHRADLLIYICDCYCYCYCYCYSRKAMTSSGRESLSNYPDQLAQDNHHSRRYPAFVQPRARLKIPHDRRYTSDLGPVDRMHADITESGWRALSAAAGEERVGGHA